jgi:hypothetical protein
MQSVPFRPLDSARRRRRAHVESRFADIEGLLLEMRGEQDRHLRQLTALRVEMDLVTAHVRDAEPSEAPARPVRARRKANG